jgi:hypothetical protein
MSLIYKHLAHYPEVFLRTSGITVAMFDEVIERLTPLWDKEIRGVYKRPGRNFKMSLADIVLMALIYYRTYTSMVWIGFLFNLNESNVSRLISRVEPILAKVMTINKEKSYPKQIWRHVLLMLRSKKHEDLPRRIKNHFILARKNNTPLKQK